MIGVLTRVYNKSNGAKYLNGLNDCADHAYNLKKKQGHARICNISLTQTQAVQSTQDVLKSKEMEKTVEEFLK